MILSTLLAQTTDSVVGEITQPKILEEAYGANGGLITFISNIISIAVLVGGLIALVNIVIAGFTYITSAGDTKATEKVLQKLNMSLWGLALMIMAPAIMAVVGWVLFKQPMFFLKPEIVDMRQSGTGTVAPTSNQLPQVGKM